MAKKLNKLVEVGGCAAMILGGGTIIGVACMHLSDACNTATRENRPIIGLSTLKSAFTTVCELFLSHTSKGTNNELGSGPKGIPQHS